MADAPAWLDDSAGASSPIPAAADPLPPAEAPASLAMSPNNAGASPGQGLMATKTPIATTTGDSSAAVEEEKDLPGVILTMRLVNMAMCILLIVVSVLTMVSFPSPAIWVLSIYAICGGILVCCLETQLKFLRVMIAMNFGFLFSFFWRFIFYLILASVCWSYNNYLSLGTAIAIVGVAFFNTYILLRYPSYRRIREKIAEEEDKRIEARISRDVKNQAMKRIRGSG